MSNVNVIEPTTPDETPEAEAENEAPTWVCDITATVILSAVNWCTANLAHSVWLPGDIANLNDDTKRLIWEHVGAHITGMSAGSEQDATADVTEADA